MKIISNKILILLSLVFALYSCNDDDMTYKDAKVTAVKKLYAPDNGKALGLLSAASATLFFEWEASKVEDSGSPLYEVIFDKLDGDFSNPIYRVISDNGGSRNYATVSHKTLNKIWSLAGVEGGQTETLKWAVITSRGLSEAMSEESRELKITRLLGFADLPVQLFIIGEATETGTVLADALEFSAPAQGEFEIFTQLTAGKTYKFVDTKNTEVLKTFYITDNQIKEGDSEINVTKTGIYRINLDFNIASVNITEVKSIGFFFSPENKVTINLDYAGKGIWTGEGNIAFSQQNWGKDERYKFQMEIINAEGNTIIQQWGAKNDTDSRPNASSPDSYYFTKEVPTHRDNNKWKLADEMDGARVKFSFILQGGAEYTHKVTKIG